MIKPLPALLGLQPFAVLELPPVRLYMDARPRRASGRGRVPKIYIGRVHFIPPRLQELGLVVDDRLRCELVEIVR